MKKTQDSKLQAIKVDDLAEEYDFDYQKAHPNRFADKLKDRMTVTLDPDVAKVFTSAEEVNGALRAIIHAIPIK